MLTVHFKLGMQPFGVTPDPRFLYLSPTHREALASLFYGIQSGRGFAALIAPPGMGKTTLLIHLLRLLTPNAKTAFLFQTLCGPEAFLRSLLADLGIENQGDLACLHANLNAYLLKQSKNSQRVVVIIDEAQNLDDRALELVRLLSNFETPSRKLIHLVLSGQPQLAKRLGSENLIQLRQRISVVAKIAPFSDAETRAYIEHRLRVSGAAPDIPLFSDQAHALIAEHAGGIPRNVNNLCFNSLSLACGLKRRQVDAAIVREVISDLDLGTVALPKPPNVRRSSAPLSAEAAPQPTSWRYRWALMAGLLLPLALLVSHFSLALHGRLAGRDSLVVPAQSFPVANTLALQDAQDQHQAEQRTPSPASVLTHRRVRKVQASQSRSFSAATFEGIGNQAIGVVELGSLPIQHSVLESLTVPPSLSATQAVKSRPVPVEPAQPREKR